MRRTRMVAALVAAFGFGAGLAGCDASTPPAPTSSATTTEVISTDGLGPIRFGDTREELVREHGLVQGPGDCMPRLPAYPSTSPVFAEERLVLMWADPPVRTPEGLGVGSPVAEVRQQYPDAERLTAPPESFQFDGTLVPSGDRAYLFLHDQHQVQKLIVGYEQYAWLLYTENFGTC